MGGGTDLGALEASVGTEGSNFSPGPELFFPPMFEQQYSQGSEWLTWVLPDRNIIKNSFLEMDLQQFKNFSVSDRNFRRKLRMEKSWGEMLEPS